jgi:hypothetical protein
MVVSSKVAASKLFFILIDSTAQSNILMLFRQIKIKIFLELTFVYFSGCSVEVPYFSI